MIGLTFSGELKNPSESIPKGTIMAVSYTFTVYLLLFLLLSSTCDRCSLRHSSHMYIYTVLSHLSLLFPSVMSWSLSLRLLLINDYAVFQRVNVWPPIVTIGVYCASLSAAMCSMIGASRILHALALDKLFG